MDTNIWGEEVLDSKDYYDEGSVLYNESLFTSALDNTRFDNNQKNSFFTIEGEFLGHDDQDKNKVYITTRENYEYSLTYDKDDPESKPDYEGLRKYSTDLRTGYNDFINKCSAVYGESSIGYGIFVEEELYAIACVHIRNSIAYGITSKLAVKFRATSFLNRNKNRQMKCAIAAFINALMNGPDYSNGANQWDGAEQAMIPEDMLDKPSNGRFMYKVNVMGWDIKEEHYISWKEAIDKKFGDGKFTVPQKQEAKFDYAKMHNKGKIRLFSTQQLALTMFWQEI